MKNFEYRTDSFGPNSGKKHREALKKVSDEFAILIDKYVSTYDELPWWHKENSLRTQMACAGYKIGMLPASEYLIETKGKVDLCLGNSKATDEYIFECKMSEVRVLKGDEKEDWTNGVDRKIVAALTRAKNQSRKRKYRRYGGSNNVNKNLVCCSFLAGNTKFDEDYLEWYNGIWRQVPRKSPASSAFYRSSLEKDYSYFRSGFLVSEFLLNPKLLEKFKYKGRGTRQEYTDPYFLVTFGIRGERE